MTHRIKEIQSFDNPGNHLKKYINKLKCQNVIYYKNQMHYYESLTGGPQPLGGTLR